MTLFLWYYGRPQKGEKGVIERLRSRHFVISQTIRWHTVNEWECGNMC